MCVIIGVITVVKADQHGNFSKKSFKKAITRDTLMIRCTTLHFTLPVKYTHDIQHCYLKKDWDVNDQHEDRQNIHDFFFASSGNDDSDTKIMIFTVCCDILVKIHTHIFSGRHITRLYT